MAFPQQFMDELLSRNDIVDVISSYVHLNKRGRDYFGICPFHNEKTGSFCVTPGKQLYHCFGCKHGGGTINFIMEIENLSYPDAVRFLAKRVNMEVPEDASSHEEGRRRQRVLALNRDAARWFYQNLSRPEGAAAAQYLVKRRIQRKTAMDFGLGAAPNSWTSLMDAMTEKGYSKAELLAAGLIVKNDKGRFYDKFRGRLMFPVIDVRGDIVAFGGRVLDQSEPKYMNTPETIVYSKRRNLYGINLAKKTKRPNFILCEGNIDVITLHQAGFNNAVASMGTALTVEQTRILSHYTKELVLCYDNDAAGQMATQKNIDLLKNSEFTVRVLQLPRRMVDGKAVKQDVDDFIKFHGPAAFETMLSGSEKQMDYRMETIASKYNLANADDKIAYADEASRLIAALPNAVEREIYAGRAAEKAGISKEAVLLEVKRYRNRKNGQEQKEMRKEALNVRALHQPKERSIRYVDEVSAVAEEGVVQLLLTDSALADCCSGLLAEEFSAPWLGRIYQTLRDAYQEGRTMSLTLLAESCSPEEISHLAAVMQRPVAPGKSEKALSDYIRVIQRAAEKRRGGEAADPLRAAADRAKEKKGYGGKHNG